MWQDNEFTTLQAEYEDLLIRFESQVVISIFLFQFWRQGSKLWVGVIILSFSPLYLLQRTESEIQIDYLTRKLVEADLVSDLKNEDHITRYVNADATNKDRNCALRESEAILVIKRLQEQVFFLSLSHISLSVCLPIILDILLLVAFSSSQLAHFGNNFSIFNFTIFILFLILQIRMLEMQNSSSQQNLDSIADLAMEQNICARQRIGEVFWFKFNYFVSLSNLVINVQMYTSIMVASLIAFLLIC